MAGPYATIFAGLSPAAAAGDVVTTVTPLLSSAGGTVVIEADGTYTITGTPVATDYISGIELFDDSTGLDHVMSPFGVYVDGTIRIGNYVGLNANAAESTIEGLGLTVERTTVYSSTVAEGLVISQTPAAYWLLNASISVTLTASAGVRTFASRAVFTVNAPRMRFH